MQTANGRPAGAWFGRLLAAARPRRSAGLPRYVAAAVAAAGLITLLSAALSHRARPQRTLVQHPAPLGASGRRLVSAVAGFGLLVIAGALARRQRRAWAVAIALLLIAGAGHLVRDVDVLAAGVNLGMAGVLIAARREFDAQPGPGSIRRALLALPLLVAAAWAFGFVSILAHVGGSASPSIGGAALGALRGLIGLPLGVPMHTEGREWFAAVLPLIGVGVLVTAITVVFRPVVEGLRRSPADAGRTEHLVRRYGSDTLAYFSLRSDKSWFFHGDTVISYRYLWNLALVSGDPIGPAEDAGAATEAFIRRSRSLGWGVAVLAGGPDMADVYAGLGLRRFYLGDEAILDPRTFSLEGRPIRKVRQSCHRLERDGYRLEFVADTHVDEHLRDALAAVTKAWRGRAPERGFTMALGEPQELDDPDCLTVVARDGAGGVQGYLHLVPCYGSAPGMSLDQMRRRPDTPNGLTEWMVARTTQELGHRHMARFSLNFAFLGGLFRERTELSPLQRCETAVAQRLNPFFQIESLHHFNAKFFPEWHPRYIYYEARMSFPRVALAYLEAEAFLRLPLIGMRGRLRERVQQQDAVASVSPGLAVSGR